MRIAEPQCRRLTAILRQRFGQNARIWLFGSRVDDHRRGGDVDIYVEAEQVPAGGWVKAKLEAGTALESIFDGATVDLLVRFPGDLEQPMHRIAKQTGVPL